MLLTDSHCHLTSGKLLPRADEVLAAARAAGVTTCITVASDVADARAALGLARRHEGVFCTAGIHPHEASAAAEHALAQLEEVLAAGGAKAVAVGEIGLDYHYDFSPRDAQRRWFEAQLDLAGRLGRPVIVHTREATEDTLAMLAPWAGRLAGVIHSFTGGPDEARRFLDQGWHVSFSGIVTFRNSPDNRAAAAIVPADRLLIETDSPYLSPEPVRKIHPNTPAHVAHVARCLADARGITADALADLTTANARRLFGLR